MKFLYANKMSFTTLIRNKFKPFGNTLGYFSAGCARYPEKIFNFNKSRFKCAVDVILPYFVDKL